MSKPGHDPEACAYVIGEDGLSRLRGPHADAWIGLQRAHRDLSRRFESSLAERHGLSLSGLDLLGRLASAERGRMRLARLAAGAGLSVSRVSRIVDLLERRALVERRPCPEDTRATEAWITNAGGELARAAQADHLADVQRAFFDHLSDAELRTLGAVFTRLLENRP